VTPATRPDRRRAGRAAARKSEKRRPAPARKPASRPRPARGEPGASFLNTLIITLLGVLAVMVAIVLLVLFHYVL
jgi:hypothetical protein